MTVDYIDVEQVRIPIKLLTTVSTRYYWEDKKKFLLERRPPCAKVSFHLTFQILWKSGAMPTCNRKQIPVTEPRKTICWMLLLQSRGCNTDLQAVLILSSFNRTLDFC